MPVTGRRCQMEGAIMHGGEAMAMMMDDARGRRGIPWRTGGWGGAALLLSLPYLAGAPWTLSDYIFAGMMFGLAGLGFELAVRRGGVAYRAAAAAALAAAFLTVWVNGAVGMIGSEDNPYNL